MTATITTQEQMSIDEDNGHDFQLMTKLALFSLRMTSKETETGKSKSYAATFYERMDDVNYDVYGRHGPGCGVGPT